jgi:FemAB family protein
MQIENIKQLAVSCGLSIELRTDQQDLWYTTLMRCNYIPVMYTHASIEFQWAYQRGHGGDWQDISCLIYLDRHPVAVWPLSISHKDGRVTLSSHGLPVFPPLFVVNCSVSTHKRIIKNCLDFADKIVHSTGLSSWECAQSFYDQKGLSLWHDESMSRGATCILHHEIFLDLNLSMPEIKSHLRKSYKPLITAGMRLWNVNILNTADETVWNEFRELHYRVSERRTRSDETWALHLNDIRTQQAFLVYLRDKDGKMLGGGFFNYTRDEGLYAVAAYDRLHFDKPLGHVVQYKAIEELKKRGVRWYKIGVRSYRSDNPAPSEKEMSISAFKQGFSSHLFPRFVLCYPIRQTSHL